MASRRGISWFIRIISPGGVRKFEAYYGNNNIWGHFADNVVRDISLSCLNELKRRNYVEEEEYQAIEAKKLYDSNALDAAGILVKRGTQVQLNLIETLAAKVTNEQEMFNFKMAVLVLPETQKLLYSVVNYIVLNPIEGVQMMLSAILEEQTRRIEEELQANE
eukprot:TRINITY_DN286_c0_g1_i1.p1 TRINITY_DN286_c0_g1~~TRINITY_DN286_c0_g1_i1.p1  ORF type:complete len:163 (+),score=18.30 TRINITY_DN286_c0_g1_i1:304-792(+)